MRLLCTIPLLCLFAFESFSSEVAPSEKIDQLVLAHLTEQEIEPLPLASDEVLVRRLYLDIAGRIPTVRETNRFVTSKDPEKAAKLIDQLIGSDAYVSHYYHYWSDLLRLKTRLVNGAQSIAAGFAYERWIKEALRENRPYDEIVFDLVSATGSTWDNPAAAYYLRDFGMPLDNLALTSQIFLGTQIVCAQCHDHPFDDFTQMDYYHLAAFTYPLQTTNNHPKGRLIQEAIRQHPRAGSDVDDRYGSVRKAYQEILFPLRFNTVVGSTRALRLPHDYQYKDAEPGDRVEPRVPFGNPAVISKSTPPPEALAEWMTSAENPRFARIIANRLWAKVMGYGVFEPVDDYRDYIKPSNPALMDYLEQLMIELDFDWQAYLTILHNTETYQREANPEQPALGSDYAFPGPLLRRMTAEQIWDSVVTLVRDDVDTPSPSRDLAGRRRIAESRIKAESVFHMHPKRFANNVYEIARVQENLATEIEAAQTRVAEARENGDPAELREAIQFTSELRRKLANLVEEKVYAEGLVMRVAHLEDPQRELGASAEFLEELADHFTTAETSFAEALGELQSSREPGTGLISPIIDELFAEEKAALEKARAESVRTRRAAWKVNSARELEAFRNFNRVLPDLVRASEINSPAPRGHFLREFGQSDREMVENSSQEASMTQALAMLNGPYIGSVANPYSVLSRQIKGKNHAERLDRIYLSLFSRKPTSQEKAIFQEAWEKDPESGTVRGIIWTLLNTRQFLFVQ
ncbi:MAG: DUF1549 domain-containing protein [Verrucomicrobiota bacterium]